MSSLLATRAARRRSIIFLAFLAVTLVLMAFSSNQLVRDFQSAMSFALRPVQGALDGVASGVAGRRRLHQRDRAAPLRQHRAPARERAADARRTRGPRRSSARTTCSPGSSSSRTRSSTRPSAAEVIARESSEFRRLVTIGKGSDDGIAEGDVVIAEGGALAGRVIEVGPNFANVVLITDQTSTVIGQLQTSRATGEVVGTLEETLQMKNIDSTEPIELGEEVVTAGHRARRRHPLAVPEGPPARPGHRRPATTRTASSRRPSSSRRQTWRSSSTCWSSSTTRAACPNRATSRSTARSRARAAAAGRRAAVHPADPVADAVRPDPCRRPSRLRRRSRTRPLLR